MALSCHERDGDYCDLSSEFKSTLSAVTVNVSPAPVVLHVPHWVAGMEKFGHSPGSSGVDSPSWLLVGNTSLHRLGGSCP